MGAVLNVHRRPELLGCDEVLPVEQGLERFEDKCLVSLGCRFAHFGSPWFSCQRFSLSAGLVLRLLSCSRSYRKKSFDNAFPGKRLLCGSRWLCERSSEFRVRNDHEIIPWNATTGLLSKR